MDDLSVHRAFLDALLKDAWWWSDGRRVPTHPDYEAYQVWLDPDSGNLGFSERMVEMLVERLGPDR